MAQPHHRHLHIAMLNTDVPVPSVRNRQSPPSQEYGDIFHRLLVSAASRVSSSSPSSSPKTEEISITSKNYDVVSGTYPTDQELLSTDLIIVTGSAAAAYEGDKFPWIERLEGWIRGVYNNINKEGEMNNKKKPKFFGSCFGHQIICRALLEKNDGGKKEWVRVEKDPNGYEVGVQDVVLGEEFERVMMMGKEEKNEMVNATGLITPPAEEDIRGVLEGKTQTTTLRIQLIHGDHVRVLDEEKGLLPEGWCVVGRTKHCAVQGVMERGRVLTYQGHFEFDRFVNRETVKTFGERGGWDKEVLRERLGMIERDDDAGVWADLVVKFALE